MPRILAFCAHPDDIEFRCAGTLALLAGEGWEVGLATMTGGSGGSREYGPEEARRVRLAEAQASADVIGAEYYYAGGVDMDVDFRHELRVKTVHVLRRFRPDVVITLADNDYHSDHVETGRLVRACCFYAPIPNYPEQTLPPIDGVPALYYVSAEVDQRGREVDLDFVVDVGEVIATKERMLACHASQRDWIRHHHGVDDFVDGMRRRCAETGARAGFEYGEGFFQHLGPGYPTADAIGEALGGRVHRL